MSRGTAGLLKVEKCRDFIFGSLGELSVAKNAYVNTHCGWFSCGTACYLAAGRPAVVQDTGRSEIVPSGEGVLAFTDKASAAAALREVERHYAHHAPAPAEVAATRFDHAVVLGDLLDTIGAPQP